MSKSSISSGKIMGERADLKLLGIGFSLFTQRVVWVLKLKGIEFDYHEEEDLLKKSDLLLKSNPVHKKVPVLIHDRKAISESKIILEYIDERWKGKSILSQDPYKRAYERFWANFIDEKLVEPTLKAFTSSGEDQSKAAEAAAEALQRLEEEIGGKKFFGGEEIGFVDLVAGWMVHWLPVLEEVGGFKVMDPSKFRSINSWTKQFLEASTMKDNLLSSSHDLQNVYEAFRTVILAQQEI